MLSYPYAKGPCVREVRQGISKGSFSQPRQKPPSEAILSKHTPRLGDRIRIGGTAPIVRQVPPASGESEKDQSKNNCQ